MVLTNPKYNFHLIDAGRVIQCMQLAAWSREVAVTGYQEERLRNDFAIPRDLNISAILGFGYPASRLVAPRKNRLPLDELVYYGRYSKTKGD
jgi:nitroreductase